MFEISPEPKRVKCPYCGSENFGKVQLPEGKTFVLVVADKGRQVTPPTEGRKVDAYGCSDCGFMALRSLDVFPAPK